MLNDSLTNNLTVRQLNDWAPEVRSLLKALVKAGFKLDSGNNGEDDFKFTGNLAGFIDNLIACDEAHLYIRNPDGKAQTLFLVLGNSPGELVCDYTCSPTVEAVVEAHYNKWEGRKQPTKDCPYDAKRVRAQQAQFHVESAILEQ